jgi:hypothetical protein
MTSEFVSTSIIPVEFPVLGSLIRVALDTLAPARANPSRFIPVLTQVIRQLTNLWYSSSGETAKQFDDSTFTKAMDRAMLGLLDMVCDLFCYFLADGNDPRLYPVFDPDCTFDVMEAQLKDAWALFENA